MSVCTRQSTLVEPKTKATAASVGAFLDAIIDDQRRADCKRVANLMQKITGKKPKMWGSSIVGFDSYHYVYASGRSGDAPLTAFSPRAQALTLYVMSGFDREAELMQQLGKFKTGKSCLYIKSLADVELAVLETLISQSVTFMREKYPKD